MSEVFWTILQFPAWNEWQFWLFVALPTIAAAWFVQKRCRPSVLGLGMIDASVVACLVFLFLGVFLSHGPTERLLDDPRIRVAFFQDDVLLRDAVGEHFWRWELGSGQKLVAYMSFQQVSMRLSPVTDNPKVRPLAYQVQVEVDYRNPEALKRYFAGVHGKGTLDTFTRRLLFEFNELNSRRLGEFYNPLREDQQTEFWRLVEEGIGEELAQAGLRIVSIRFDLAA